MEFFIVLFIGLFFFALIGHLLWLLIKATYWALVNAFQPRVSRALKVEMCPRCHASWSNRHQTLDSFGCTLCSWEPRLPPSADKQTNFEHRKVIQYLLDRVAHFERIGLISKTFSKEISTALKERTPRPVHADQLVPLSGPNSSASEIVFDDPPDHDEKFVPDVDEPIIFIDSEVAMSPQTTAAESIRKSAEKVSKFVVQSSEFSYNNAAEASLCPVEKPAPKREVFEVFSAFLEERNLRWGELVGGLLIVGCSLALVLSFWSRIAERPLLKFALFDGVTALIYITGLVAYSRWKLPNSATGLLIIATLLTPLNSLAIAALGVDGVSGSILELAGESFASLLFGFLVYRAGRILTAVRPISLTFGVVVPSISMLLVHRWLAADPREITLILLGAIPLASLCIVQARAVLILKKEPALGREAAIQLLLLFGLGGFATALAVGLVAFAGHRAGLQVQYMTALTPVAGSAFMIPGLSIWRRLTLRESVGLRIAGTALALIGVAVMLSGAIPAWPSPSLMLAVAVGTAICMLFIAIGLDIAWAHAVAGVALGVSYLLISLLVLGHISWSVTESQLASALLSNTAGKILTPFGIMYFTFAYFSIRKARRDEARSFFAVGSAAVFISLAVLSWHVLNIPRNATDAAYVFLCDAVSLLTFAVLFGWHPLVNDPSRILCQIMGWIGRVLLFLGLVLCIGNIEIINIAHISGIAYILADLVLASLISIALWIAWRKTRDAVLFQVMRIIDDGTRISSILAAILIVASTGLDTLSSAAVYSLILATVWFILAWRAISVRIFSAGQAALAYAVGLLIARALEGQAWFANSPQLLLDPWFLQADGIGMAVLCVFWSGLRPIAARQKASDDNGQLPTLLLSGTWYSFDRIMRPALIVLATALSLYAAAPGVMRELTPRNISRALTGETAGNRIVPPLSLFEIAGVSHVHAYGAGAWGLIIAALFAVLADLWNRVRRWGLLAALLLFNLTVLLAAAPWESQVSSSSALRWSLAIGFFIGSALIWLREPLRRIAVRFGINIESCDSAWMSSVLTLHVGFYACCTLAMVGYVAVSAAWNHPFGNDFLVSWWSALAICFAFLLVFGISREIKVTEFVERKIPGANGWLQPTGMLVAILGVLPILAISVYGMLASLKGNPIVGPDPTGLFATIGPQASYVPPILIVAAAVLGFAIRERSSRFGFVTALALNLAITTAYQIFAMKAGIAFGGGMAIRLSEWNAIVAGICAISWMAVVHLRQKRRGVPTTFDDPYVDLLVMLGVAIVTIVYATATVVLWFSPVVPTWLISAGDLGGLAAVAIVAGALALLRIVTRQNYSPHLLGLFSLILAAFASLVIVPRDTGNWLTYHTMIVTQGIAAMLLPLGLLWLARNSRHDVSEEARRTLVGWSWAAAGIVAFYAIGGVFSDPYTPYWSAGGVLFVAITFWLLAYVSGNLVHLPVSAVFAATGAAVLWKWSNAWSNTGDEIIAYGDLLNAIIIAIALPCPVWLWIERKLARRDAAVPSAVSRLLPTLLPGKGRSLQWWASQLALGFFAANVALGLVYANANASEPPAIWLGWLTIFALLAAILPTYWDRLAPDSTFDLYLLGIAVCGWEIRTLPLSGRYQLWLGSIELAALGLTASFLWCIRDRLRPGLDRLRIPRREEAVAQNNLTWLVPANVLLAAVVLLFALLDVFSEPNSLMRMTAAGAAFTQALAIGLLAVGKRRAGVQSLALIFGVLGVLVVALSPLDPSRPDIFYLDRAAIAATVVVAMAWLYGFWFSKFLREENDWTARAQKLVPQLMFIAAVGLVGFFTFELYVSKTSASLPVSSLAIGLMAASIAGSIVFSLIAALVPGRDLLGLSERGRTGYIYASEIMITMLVAHFKMTMPWLFGDFFVKYWVPIVMLISFLGVGLGELFRRQKRLILAEPLENTGVFLPILPLISAFWLTPKPGEDVVFLFLIGLLYSVVSALRSSLLVAAFATLAYNASLWMLLDRWPGLGFSQHPQLWVIPGALSVLAAAYLHRDKLTREQLATVRYVASVAIYLSSSTEMILTGIAQAPWLPVILAGLSIVGIFSGILLKIRGFLFLGTGFLCLALFSMIWHAAMDLKQTWLWWVFGILCGMMILGVFALFEKKRLEVLDLLTSLQDWDA